QFNHVHDQRTTGHSTANQVEVVVKLLESEAMIRVQSTEVNHPACKLMDALRSLNLKVHYASVSCVKDLMLQDVIVKVPNGFTSDEDTLRLAILNKMGGGGEKCVKEKQHTSTNDATKDIVVVSPPAVDEPVVDTGNTKDVNAGRTSIDSTVDPNSETLGVNMDWLSECLTRLPGCSSSSLALWMGRSSFARAMIELRADVELKDTIVVAMPKLVAEGFYTCNIRVEY
nr:Myc-type, basic helix-loop-helix (bHLH) domain-containing protein [Tanacetum cinerariifolium]